MRNQRLIRTGFGGILAIAALGLGCGSSTTTSTAPSSIPRCAVTLTTGETPMSAAGGTGRVAVSASRECAWTAGVEGAWLRIRSGANGQGDGAVEFSTDANADPQTRTGAVIVNGQRAQVTQAAGVCEFTLPETSASFPPAGGSRRIDVRASSALCRWTASSDAPWIEIKSGSTGQGNDPVMIEVAATTGPPRTGALTIAGQRFSVTQSQGCEYAINPQTHSSGSAGGSGTVTIATSAGCPWTAVANDPWITVAPASGAGPGPVTFTIAATTGPTRTGSALIAGQLFSVTQSPGCTYQVEPTTIPTPSSGGTAEVTVDTSAGCTWTAASNVPWITVQSGASGSGAGSVRFAVAATTGPARTGTLTVAGRQITVTQGTGCTYAIAPRDQSIAAGGGAVDVTVTAGAGCAWTAASNAPWITVGGGNRSGNGVVPVSVAVNDGPARSGTATIAGRTFTVNQASGCSYTVAPPTINTTAAGGPAHIDVTAANGCSWTAASSASWIVVTPPGSGSGNGGVDVTVAANTGPARNGSVTIAARTVTVNQESGCTIAIDPLAQTFSAAGGTATITVTAAAGCTWTATTSVPWVTVTSGGTGSGNGTVQIAVEPNGTGVPRSGSVAIGGRLFSVTQE